MSAILAERFLPLGRTRSGEPASWIDLASGERVIVRLAPAGSRHDQMVWSRGCEVLSNLRHPLINPLLDFGLAGGMAFEAYREDGRGEPPRRPGPLARHAARFLTAHGLDPAGVLGGPALRGGIAMRPGPARPLGVSLQPRSAYDAIVEALDTARPAGASAIAIAGPDQSGLRTLRVLAARAARLQGYVPVTPRALHIRSWVVRYVAERHVCVLVGESDDGSGAAVAALLARLTAAGARRHVVLSFVRARGHNGRGISLDWMGVRAMTSMVYIDPEQGPAPDDLIDAARKADGRPGLFLSQLGSAAFECHRPVIHFVHETSPEYVVSKRPSVPGPAGSRRNAVALRAVARAEMLARQGRHSSALRVLVRACRLLRARGDVAAAAHSALVRGWLLLDRGQIGRAVDGFDDARELAPEGATGVAATMGVGLAWLEEGRLVEAEAALRNALLAAQSLSEGALWCRCASALARSLFWQGRYDEAAALIADALAQTCGDVDRSGLLAMSARVHLAEGSLAPALRAARAAVELARGANDPRAMSSAGRVSAAVLLAAGDIDAARSEVRKGLSNAHEGRLPLLAVRLRLVLLGLLAEAGDRAGARRLAVRLNSSSSRVPRLLRFQIRAGCAAALGASTADVADFVRATGAVALLQRDTADRHGTVAELETFLQIGQTASDDRAALERMAADLGHRLRAATLIVGGASPERRVLAVAGRSWSGEPQILWRTVSGGCPVPPDRDVEPVQAAEPIRYGGELVGAAAARWIAGTALDRGRVMTLLRYGALAMAPHVRALLDQPVRGSASATWKDLLGESDVTARLRDSIVRSARAPFAVLIEGESGVGKELVARAIHRLGPRRDRRFCAINCAALSDDLLEAELFGHARGSFTGAIGDRPGLFEDADGGTLFLDEIGELSARAQAKLLRVLQDGEVRRIGENVARRVDVRIVAATNRRLEQEVAAGRFRADLRFRLDVVRIDVPPLRDRASDVPILAAHFWEEAVARVGSRATLTPDTLAALSRYDWPGNVRELQNVIAWIAVHSPQRGRIGPAALPSHLARASTPVATTFEEAREDFERRFVKAALASANGHRLRAARSMGISRQGLAKMLRRLGLDGKIDPL
jgi:DNA-binding NtrC family response regulator/tetratricopeptide (TPR) repeat protein